MNGSNCYTSVRSTGGEAMYYTLSLMQALQELLLGWLGRDGKGLIVTNLILIAVTIATLISMDSLQFEHLLIASVAQGLSMNAMMPARQALTKDVVGLDGLTNAIALNTSGMNTARLLLPGLAGGMVAALGGGDGNIEPARWVYFLMTGLYLMSVVLEHGGNGRRR